MADFITWVTENWRAVLEGVFGLLVVAGIITGFFEGPKADEATTWIDKFKSWLRALGIGTYKDEPGSVSMPFAPDTKKRVVATRDLRDKDG